MSSARSPSSSLPGRSLCAAGVSRAAGDAGVADGAPIPTRRRWRRAPTRPRRTWAIRSTSTSVAIGKTRRAGEPARRRWSWGRSRCSTARRASRTWATGGCGAQFTLTVAAYEPGRSEVPADRGDLPRPARRRADGADGAGGGQDQQPHRQRAGADAQGRGAARDGAWSENLWPVYIAGGLLAAALGALLTMLIVRRLRARRGERPGPPPRPAHEVALERLDRLGAYGFLENADNRPFYFAVSEIIREYLGGRFGFDSLEMTTDELVAELRRRAGRRAGAGRDRGLAVGLRPGEVRQDLPDRGRGARRAGDRDPHRRPRRARVTRAAAGAPAAGAGRRRAAVSRRPTRRVHARARASPTGSSRSSFVPLAVAYFALLRDVEGFRFAHPFALALIPLGGGAGAVGGPRARARRGGRSSSTRAPRELGAERPGLVARLRDLPMVLRLAAVVLVGVALARPQSTQRRPTTSSSRASTSSSRSTCRARWRRPTWSPNRLEAAKAVIQDFVRRRPTDRIGLVVFGREAYTDMPLTLDHGTFLRMLAELHVGIIDGAGHRHRQRDRRGAQPAAQVRRQVEGDHPAHRRRQQRRQHLARAGGALRADAGREDLHRSWPATATREAADARGGRQRQPVNPKLLEEIASMTGGTPYLATDTRALARALPEHPRGSGEVAHPRPRHALRRALPALPAGRRSRCSLLEIVAAPHPLAAVALTMRFANPHAALAAPGRPGGGARLRAGVRLAAARCWRAWATRRWSRAWRPSVSVPRKVVRAALVVTALALLALALARPQAGGRARARRKQRGLDLVVALDFSRSMLAKDVYPSRLERAKRELEQLLDRLGGDRVGLVAFAGETPDLPADHRLRGGEAVLARPRPLGHAGGRHRDRAGDQERRSSS